MNKLTSYSMQTRHKLLILTLVLAMSALLTGCFSKKPATPARTNTNQSGQPAAPAQTITVADQMIIENTVTIGSVKANQDSWLVIHAESNGTFGPVIGQAAVKSGQSDNVNVVIDQDQATPTLYAMLHIDAGKNGEYEFPGADLPAQNGSDMVIVGFAATGNTPVPAGTPPADQVKIFNITAEKFSFKPAVVSVRVGDKVRLIIKSIDADHGVSIPAYGINQEVKVGTSQVIEFTADKAGEFEFVCSVFCGSGHTGMKGRLIVR